MDRCPSAYDRLGPLDSYPRVVFSFRQPLLLHLQGSQALSGYFIVAAVCGWVVARFHRKQQRAAVLLFAGSMLLMNLLLFARHVAIVGARVAYAFVGPLSFYVLASVMGILLGGELLRLSSKRENREGRTAD